MGKFDSLQEKDIIRSNLKFKTNRKSVLPILEFRCYFCDEIKNEEPFFFEISGQRKEPVCSRCHDKMEVVKRLRKEESKG